MTTFTATSDTGEPYVEFTIPAAHIGKCDFLGLSYIEILDGVQALPPPPLKQRERYSNNEKCARTTYFGNNPLPQYEAPSQVDDMDGDISLAKLFSPNCGSLLNISQSGVLVCLNRDFTSSTGCGFAMVVPAKGDAYRKSI